jgi:HlyD family secretion protein
VLLVAGGGAWTLLVRPVSVQVSQPEKNVLVQAFGLGTARMSVTASPRVP